MNKYLKFVFLAARVLLGATFLFSGFVKAIDPIGTVYKFSEYFLAFGWNIPENIVQLLAILQAAFEFSLGALLLLGIWNNLTKWVAFLFMLFMTPFTLYVALKNPVSDCGCFGDAIVITNWQTFFKNIVLLSFSLLLLKCKISNYSFFGEITSRWSFFWTLLFPVLLSVYAFNHLPLIDFRPYKVGNNIKELTQLPPAAVTDSFDYSFTYEKDGIKKSFSMDEIPKSNSGWKYIDREIKLVREGEKPVIGNLVILHPLKGDITKEILNDTSYVFLLISPKLETADNLSIDRINTACSYAQAFGYKFYGLTASDASSIDEWSYEYDAGFGFCTLDDKVCETIIRSNPGILLLKNGIVIKKWASGDIPDFSEIKVPLNLSHLGRVKKTGTLKIVLLLAIGYLVPLLFFNLLHTGKKMHLKRKIDKNPINNIQV
jgi:uncharacterized membrane protein YphA (DoxX/SURF4 family)